jgi:hypothetical protein
VPADHALDPAVVYHLTLEGLHVLVRGGEWQKILNGDLKLKRVIGAFCEEHEGVSITVTMDGEFPLVGTYISDEAVDSMADILVCPGDGPCGLPLRIARY